MNATANQSVSIDAVEPANHARRDMFRMAGAGLATAAPSAAP